MTITDLARERADLVRQRAGLEQALERAQEGLAQLSRRQRQAAERGDALGSAYEQRRLMLLAAAEGKRAMAADELETLDRRLAQIQGEILALQAPALEEELDRQARRRLQLAEVETRIVEHVSQLERALCDLAVLSPRPARPCEALAAVSRLARRLGLGRQVSLREFRRLAAAQQRSASNGSEAVGGLPSKLPPCLVASSERSQRRIRRLLKDKPQLAERVLRGELTPGGAYREAGWP
jgi:chromosome segregation ATPase